MRIQESNDQVVIADSPASLFFACLLVIAVGLAFFLHAVDEWRAFLAGARPSLTSVLLATLGVIAAAIICAIVLPSRSRFVIDRADRKLTVTHGRLLGSMVEEISLDEIVEVTVKAASGGEDYEIDVIKRSGTPMRLSSTIQSLNKAKEIAAAIEEARGR